MNSMLVLLAALALSSSPELAELTRVWSSAYLAPAGTPPLEVELLGTLPPQAAGKCLPVAVGAVAVVYNALLAGDLRLDNSVLDGIYAGRIKRMNDPLIQALNPGVRLPDLPLRPLLLPVDAEILRAYLPSTRSFAGLRTAAAGDEVRAHEGTIAVLSAAVARRGGFELAALRNKDGGFVLPDPHSLTRAAVGVKLPPDLRGSLIDAIGVDSYPLASLVYACSRAPGTAAPFLDWALREGQKMLTPLGYAPLPALLVLSARQQVR